MAQEELLQKLFKKKNFTPNENQYKAIINTEGPLMLTAGPGSGKTRVLLWRTLYLIVEKKVNPDEIFLATFTKKASQQLIDGLQELLNYATEITNERYDISQMYVGTLHSLCERLLKDRRFVSSREDGSGDNDTIVLDELSQYFFVSNSKVWKELLRQAGYDVEGVEDLSPIYKEINSAFDNYFSSKSECIENCISFFNRMAEENFSDEQLFIKYKLKSEENYNEEEIKQEVIYKEFAERQKKKQEVKTDVTKKLFLMTKIYRQLLKNGKVEKVDFAILQQKALELILSKKENSKVFKYVIVDEYQDTNTIQQEIYFALIKEYKNICVVGDDDQALYRFRGATVENLVGFEDI